MKLKTMVFIVAGLICAQIGAAGAEEMAAIKLVKPDMSGGKPLMQALKERESYRDISDKELPPQVLSDLLWASSGINRPDTGKRTAPSARDWREISVYAATTKGLYLYNAAANALEPLVTHDIRPLSDMQPAALSAPVLLLYVADYSKIGKTQPDMMDFYSAADTGFISQNVYLFCASENLATVVMGGIDRDLISKQMGLKPGQKVILVQPVGYPKPERQKAKG